MSDSYIIRHFEDNRMKEVIKRLKNIVVNKNGQISNRKISFFLLFMNIITSAAVSIYIPCMRQMAVDLHTTNEWMQMSIVAHLVGEFFGRAGCGPLIDIKGTKAIIVPALVLSILGHLGCSLSTDFFVFICMRFFQALGSSVVYVISLSIINDIFSGKEKAGVVGILELYQPIAWILSPFVGAILSEVGNWRLSFIVLMISQIFGLVFFAICPQKDKSTTKKDFSVMSLVKDYGTVLTNLYFVTYALIPGLFAGGYMIFATNCPVICAQLIGTSSTDIAVFSAVPLSFYVMSTFIYRVIIQKAGIYLSKWIGTTIYVCLGIYIVYLVLNDPTWSAIQLLSLMCIQCMGSAFLVPVSIIKALKSASDAASVGASTVVVFRNIVMSLCISISTKFAGSITTIMACVFMTVGTVLMLFTTRRIIKVRSRKKLTRNR
ncbi:MAG: multidrug effflux MFS transporter [Alphaproteobacteria bacterium]|nr:multidrug effflux MFS transporter [Alphaproteobacteria bacterium]